ncbi:MAG TPA: hypothetical protein VMS29_05785 [Pyrinomonadaceae bacterium]|nr:hypothetical protein [Pyrinomonadaceae bacterium]
MRTHRNYHLPIESHLNLEEIRTMVEELDDGTYFMRIDTDSDGGPFAELHGDPKNSDKIAQKLAQIARSKAAGGTNS